MIDVTIQAGNGADAFFAAKGGVLERDQTFAGMSLLFADGKRPSVDDVERVLNSAELSNSGACISFRPNDAEGWVELLVNGLTFDMAGLKPATAEPLPECAYSFGLGDVSALSGLEAVSIMPGQHIYGGRAMQPVVRSMTSVMAQLALPLSAKAVCWHPASIWMEPSYFARIVMNWVSGGAFPALGLTAVDRTDEGAVQSKGLDYFIGQEVLLPSIAGEEAADTVKLAVRLIDYLVRNGPLDAPQELEGPGGETLLAEPPEQGNHVRIVRGA